jgi:chemotaxis protein methyltransferase CheR
MDNRDCTAFLQWALPQRDLRWPGFRKVRHQVYKRLKRRIRELGLDDLAAYRRRLEADPAEWRAFDECCHITISRFFRDQGVFEVLRERVLPDIATRVVHEKRAARIWSAGCASGEEPYTLKIIFDREVACSVSGAPASIVATDIDETVLARSLVCRAAIGDLQDIVRAIKARGASLKATEQPIDTSTAASRR